MTTTYNVYRNDEKIATGLKEKTYTDEGLEPDTEYVYQVSAENEVGESELSDAITVKTDPVKVTGVTVSPKTSTAESGEAGSRDLTATVEPSNATNKSITFSTEDIEGLSVSSSGKLEWTADTPAGTYETTVTTEDGGFTDTHTLILEEQDEPEHEEGD